MKNNKLRKKIRKSIDDINSDKSFDEYRPKLFGESKTVSYESKGLVSTFCMVTEWPSGEGFDVSIDTDKDHSKRISLHTDELETLLACLDHLKYFDE